MTDSTRRKSATKSPAKSKATPAKKPKFPLWQHAATGQWVKKINGWKYYFGTDKDAALVKYLRVKDVRAIGGCTRKEHRGGAGVLFVTKYGAPWHVDGATGNPISSAFRKLLNKLDLYREGLSFYALRHSFQTVADECGDYLATKRIMGHADRSISDLYRERFSDDRLVKVIEHVHAWLFPSPAVENEGLAGSWP